MKNKKKYIIALMVIILITIGIIVAFKIPVRVEEEDYYIDVAPPYGEAFDRIKVKKYYNLFNMEIKRSEI